MIVYTTSCLPCTHKRKWRELKQFAREHSMQIEERRVTRNPEWRAEAEQYEIDMPFIVHDKVALSLSEPLEGLL